MEQHEQYLSLLGELTGTLAQLTETAGQKTAAVRRDDLAALDAVLKREQALTLSLRGCEQKRLRLLSGLGLSDTPLASLAEQYPPALRLTAKAAVQALQRQFQLYRSAADAARSTLECNLHQIEKYLSGAADAAGPGYQGQAPDVEPPPALRSDFRA